MWQTQEMIVLLSLVDINQIGNQYNSNIFKHIPS